MKQIAGISVVLTLLCVSCDTSSKPVFDDDNSNYTSIAHLKSLCRGTSTVITQELKIRGVVTANDMRGEFPKAIVLEDAGCGIEIAMDHTALADLFPLGAGVTVYCTGLAIGEYGGKVQLGAQPTGTYSVDRINRADIGRYLRCTELNTHTRRPHTRNFTDISLADADTYVRFETVHFAEAGISWCDSDPENGKLAATQRALVDAAGETFPVRILPDCHYATEPIPQGTGSVNGIIDYFNGELSLRIVNYEIDISTFAAPPTAYPSTAEYSAQRPTR